MHLQFIPAPSRKYVIWIWLGGDVAALWLLHNHETGARVRSQGGKALRFQHRYIHLLKLSLNLMSPRLLHRMLLSAPAE